MFHLAEVAVARARGKGLRTGPAPGGTASCRGRVAQCRLHGPREARDQDDVAHRESAAQNFVEPVDERWDLLRLHLRLPPASPCDRNAARPSEPIELPIEVRVRTNSQHLGESE